MRRYLFAAVALALLITGCHHRTPSEQASAAPPNGQPLQISPPKNPGGQAMIYVINPKATGNDDPLMSRTITLSHPESPAHSAIDALLSDPNTPVPTGTSLRGLTIESALATLDFSRSPVNETGGEGGQGDALTALARTLGQFPEIEKFQISVKGKLTKSFGEFTTDGPMDVTRPEKISDEKQPETKP